jgi:hypothetical protein
MFMLEGQRSMTAGMTSEQRYGWQVALEYKLRRSSGVAFQDFFADVMTRAHGDDFVPTRPRGNLGDRGCDGYLASVGRVFACYGKVDDAALSVPTILAKMDEDYGKAATHLKDVMREWCFVHNMLDGTATDATVIKLGEMRRANAAHGFTTMGRAGFEMCVLGLPEADIISLIGMAVTAEDTRNMRLELVAELVEGIMAAVDGMDSDFGVEPKAVPLGKLDFNGLAPHWRFTVRSQMPNVPLVDEYLGRHRDPERGEKVAAIFRARYRSLKEQGLAPDDIMASLYEAVVGKGTVTNDRMVAAQALLAYLFDACDIFEDKPAEDAR